jgi:hypothetical protein
VIGNPHLGPRPRAGPGKGMNLTHGICSCNKDAIKSRIYWRARNRSQLQTGT